MKTKLPIITTLILSAISSEGYAAGFQLMEQSVTGLGRAFAGSAVVAEDASTIFFNAAGLAELDSAELDVGLNYIAPKIEFEDGGSTSAFSEALTGSDGGDTGKNALVPNLYYAQPYNEKITVGFGVNAPFGLVTDYSDAWKGRYHADRSGVKTLNLNPSFAYKATDKVSVGLGISLQKIEVELSQAVDLGAPALSQLQDGKVKLEGNDWSWGYNLGLILQPTDSTRVGLAYRSKISHTITGKGKLRLADDSLHAKEHIKSDIDLPETVSLAIQHQLTPKWSVLADATWTRWSRFKELTVASSGGTFDVSKAEDWKNVMRYGIGVDYHYNDEWTLRSGIAYDESPVSNSNRTARLPDANRHWFSVGASYKASENIIIDAGYTLIVLDDAKINEDDGNGYTLTGKYDSSTFHILGAQLRWLL